jgi:CDP-diacylglycerol--glycerol-3-phosphate 3-phosphatidyltransferase
MLEEKVKKDFPKLLPGVIDFLVRLNIKPNWLTTLGVVIGAVAGFMFARGLFVYGGLAVLVSGLCDMFDGALARHSGDESLFGTFYDSVMDRYAELFIFIGLTVYYANQQDMAMQHILAQLSLAGSLLVSYTRARAEGLGKSCTVGFMQRPERMIVLIIAALLSGILGSQIIMTIALWILAVSTNFTAVQRILHIRQKAGRVKDRGRN